MPLYTITRTKTALSTSNDLLTIVASSTKPLRVYVIALTGAGTASADNEVAYAVSSSGTTPGGGITPSPIGHSGTASFNAYTTWSAQPTLGVVQWRFQVNANGGQDKFQALPGFEFTIPVGGQRSIRSISGTSSVTLDVYVEEVEG